MNLLLREAHQDLLGIVLFWDLSSWVYIIIGLNLTAIMSLRRRSGCSVYLLLFLGTQIFIFQRNFASSTSLNLIYAMLTLYPSITASLSHNLLCFHVQ
ncbi:hypothetical protein F4860DRAFT_484447 [Xylaria cubensis]|nr:hypothetical protein F4860DRAFT_484447 [Xylaria cubensis]